MPQAPVRPQRKAPARRDDDTVAARANATWEQAVRAFLADKRGQNLSPATLENYEGHLLGSRSKQFRSDHSINGPADLSAEALAIFQAELLDAGVSPALAHAYHRVTKNFARFAIDRGYGTDPRILTVRAPRLPQTEPAIFTKNEIEEVLAAAKTPRDRFLVEFLLHTGLRLRELVALTLDDIVDGDAGHYLRVRQGKGRKDRIVPLDTPKFRLSKKLQHYVDKIRPTDSGTNFLFLTSRKTNKGRSTPLTPRGVQIMFRRLSEDSGVHVHPHKFRHTFATRSLAAGVNVMALKRVLGHTTLAMVSRYEHYQSEDLIEAWHLRRD